jgi:hypothetical protein
VNERRVRAALSLAVALAAADARGDASPPGGADAVLHHTVLVDGARLTVEVDWREGRVAAERVTVRGAKGRALIESAAPPRMERLVKLGPGGVPDAPFWYLLIGWGSPRAGLLTSQAWMVGVDASGVRIADRFALTTDDANAALALHFRDDQPEWVDRIGLPHPGRPTRPSEWGFVICDGKDFPGYGAIASLPYAEPGAGRTEWYLPPRRPPATDELKARKVAWFSPSPCFHAWEANPRPYRDRPPPPAPPPKR